MVQEPAWPPNPWRILMLISLSRLVAVAALAAAATGLLAAPASAAPVGGIALKNAAPAMTETVQWRGRGYWRGGHWWGGPAAGFAAGALIGGAIAGAPYYYGGGPYYAYPEPYYDGPAYAEEPAYAAGPGGGGDAAYCAQRFKSYNPDSGTYLGYDGQRHPCP
jgi:hypothetical protein